MLKNNFKNQYPLSKTLKFELRPIGNTEINIKKKGLLEQDNQRAENYKKVKKFIDKYHRNFIDKALDGLELSSSNLDKYYQNYTSRNYKKDIEENRKALKDSKYSLRKEIGKRFKDQEGFASLHEKELIEKNLCLMDGLTEDDKVIIKGFKGFTTYFGGFHENRKNIYSDEEKSTSIAYRLIDDNLPKFIENVINFEKIKESLVSNNFTKLIAELGLAICIARVEEAFAINFFNKTLTQTGIEKYNLLLSGKTLANGESIKGLNQYINLYNQEQIDKKDKLPRLKQLYKQILSDRDTASFRPENLDNDSQLLYLVNSFYEKLEPKLNSIKNLMVCLNSGKYDLDKIYIKNDSSIPEISREMFADWGLIKACVINKIKKENEPGKKAPEKYNEYIENLYKQNKFFSINFINDCLCEFDNDNIKNTKIKTIELYFSVNVNTNIQCIKDGYDVCKPILEKNDIGENSIKQNKEKKDKIKNLLDSIKVLQKFIKPLNLNLEEAIDKDVDFYNGFDEFWNMLDSRAEDNIAITTLYNQARNYLTKKPYSLDKIKLNFENPNLLRDWADGYGTKDGLIFVKDNNYFLSINDKKLTKEVLDLIKTNPSANSKRIIIDSQRPDNKNLPRLFIRSKGDNVAPAVKDYNLDIESIIDIYDNGKFKTDYKKTDEKEFKRCLILMIDYFKNGLKKHESYKHYDFDSNWKETSVYKDISEFYNDTKAACYRVIEESVNWDEVLKLVEEGGLYLFQIYNKDFSPYSKGTPNLHTLYWQMLFDQDNLKNVVYKLNGEAEVFYRKASLKVEKPTHPKGISIKNKNENNPNKENTFDYDIVKDKRYSDYGNVEGRFFFHVPITLNFKAEGKDNIDEQVKEYLKKATDFKVIGIDRGERNLLYISIIDSKGNLEHQESFNIIKNNIVSKKDNKKFDIITNYHDILKKREGDNKDDRRNWDTINTIKEIKEGYLSQVIHKITELIIEHNAIIVLENLNMGFKNSRVKFEKAVYQKFEKMLIDKLNYLVFKTNDKNEMGGLLNAYQLSNKFESFEKLGKQSGFLFYVPAWNTSKICPVTGFVNLLDTKYQSVEKAIELLSKFSEMRFNHAKDWFEFTIENYTAFNSKAADTRQNWIICTYKDRIESIKNSDNKWDTRIICLSNEFKVLFKEHGINYSDNLKAQILVNKEANFFKGLLRLLKLTLQLRNSDAQDDYIISPVCDNNGGIFDSRDKKYGLPEDADANGAYNIARKGLWLVEQIKELEDFKKLPTMDNPTWLQFAQKSDR